MTDIRRQTRAEREAERARVRAAVEAEYARRRAALAEAKRDREDRDRP